MPTFGQRILEVRKRLGWSQHELAERVGTSGPIIGRYERGQITPSIEVASKIAAVLGVTLDYLCGGTDQTTTVQDQVMLERLEQIEQLDPQERRCLLFIIDGVLRDAQARKTYARIRDVKAENIDLGRHEASHRRATA